jgi:hypothetical protein
VNPPSSEEILEYRAQNVAYDAECEDDNDFVDIGTFGCAGVLLELGDPIHLARILNYAIFNFFDRFLGGATDVLERSRNSRQQL